MDLKKQKIILIVCSVLIFAAPLFVHAAGLVPCGSNGQNPCTVKDVFVLIARVTNWLIAVAGLFAVYQIIVAGFRMVISLGNEEAITTQKSTITNAIIGLVLALMAFVLVNTVVNVLLVPLNGKNNCPLNLSDPLSYLTIKNNNDCSK